MRSKWFLPLVLAAGISSAGAAVIDFEDISTTGPGTAFPTLVFHQYDASLGVVFNDVTALDYSLGSGAIPGFAHSGTRGIEQCYGQEFCTKPIGFTFSTAQRRVKVWVGYRPPLVEIRAIVLRAFDAVGSQVAEARAVLSPSLLPQPIRIPLEAVSTSVNIRSASVSLVYGISLFPIARPTNGLAVDDVEFDTAGPPSACPAAAGAIPVILEPMVGKTVQLNEFTLRGEILTAAPLEAATMFVVGGTGASTFLDLRASGVVLAAGGPFGPVKIQDMLFPGANSVVIAARNCKGGGSMISTVDFTAIAAGTRFQVMGIEITQAIQSVVAPAVPLIADKRAVVRVYLRTNGPTSLIRRVSADLSAHRPSDPPTLPPSPGPLLLPILLRSTNVVDVDSSSSLAAERAAMTASLNFELPPGWRDEGELYLRVAGLDIDGIPSPLPCDGCDNLNPFGRPRFLLFETAPPLRLKLWTVPYTMTIGGVPTIFTPSSVDFGFLASWLARAYPTSLVSTTMGTTKGFNGQPDKNFDATAVNLRLMRIWINDMVSGGDRRTRYLGVVADGGAFLRGRAISIPGKVASGPAGVPPGPSSTPWDTDACGSGTVSAACATYGDWYGAHELGHLYGRKHPGFCGESNDDDDYPYAGGLIGGAAGNEFGFDLGDPGNMIPRQVYPPTIWADLMTYCENQWISDYTYTAILERLRVIEMSALSSPVLVPATDPFLVVARINLATDTVDLSPFTHLPGAILTDRPEMSPFTIDFLASGGMVLASYPFQPMLATDAFPGEDPLGTISEVVEYPAGTAMISISKEGVELASRTLTPQAPTVILLAPNGGETLSGGPATVRWQAFDMDGDSLFFDLLYSPDAGDTWQVVDAEIQDLQYNVDPGQLPGGGAALFRVVATDGAHTSRDDSDGPFTVPAKPPRVRIVAPEPQASFTNAQTIVFTGEASDLEDGDLDGSALAWSSSLQGGLGSGRSIAAGLFPGSHMITLLATDSSGASTPAVISVSVEAVPPLAHAGRDSTSLIGTAVRLDGTGSRGFGSLSFQWSFVAKPRLSRARFTGRDTPRPLLTPDLPGIYVLELRIVDGAGLMAFDRVTIRASTFF